MPALAFAPADPHIRRNPFPLFARLLQRFDRIKRAPLVMRGVASLPLQLG